MQQQELHQGFPHLAPGHHSVHKTVFLLIFRPLEALWQGLPNGLLNDPWAGKANEGAGLCQNDVAQGGKAGRHAAGSGICEHGYIQ